MTSRGAEKMNNDTIGVDVSKDHLDAHRLADGATRRFANTKGGHKALIKWVAETPLYRVVFEPTGLYHRAVERALGIAGVPFVKVNPRQARRFAEATGKLAKTDRLDAAILARMGALLELEARPARSELLFELKELYVAREALVKDRTAAKNRGKALTLSLLKRQNAQRLEQIDRQIATVEAAILQIIEANVSLADRFAILKSAFPAYPTSPPFALLIAMPELGSLEAGQAANLAGLVADRPTVRALDRSRSYSRRWRRRAPRALHARPRRRTLQPGHEGQIRSPHRNRKAGKGRLDRNHAKARRPRKRPPKGQSPLDAKNRLINTDTLAAYRWRESFAPRCRLQQRVCSVTYYAQVYTRLSIPDCQHAIPPTYSLQLPACRGAAYATGALARVRAHEIQDYPYAPRDICVRVRRSYRTLLRSLIFLDIASFVFWRAAQQIICTVIVMGKIIKHLLVFAVWDELAL